MGKQQIGVKRYKMDLKEEVKRRQSAEAREAAALADVARLEAELAEAKATPSVNRVVTKEIEKEVVRIAAPANVASGLSGTNAEKIAALEAVIGTLQERLKAAGLEWEV